MDRKCAPGNPVCPSGADLSGVSFSLSEEFTNPPEHLGHGSGAIGFTLRIENGNVEVTGAPDEEALVRVISEYTDALPLARDPNLAATDPAMMAERLASGRLKVIGNPAGIPPVLQAMDVIAVHSLTYTTPLAAARPSSPRRGT